MKSLITKLVTREELLAYLQATITAKAKGSTSYNITKGQDAG
jgi:hypothetical protein